MPATTRRHWLKAFGALVAAPVGAWAALPPSRMAASAAPQFAAAWAVGPDLFVGVLQPHALPTQALRVLQSHATPTRAHGMTRLSDGSLLFASRRPGDWLLRIHPNGREQWQWIEPDRAFNGHVIASHDGAHIYTTETDLADSQGLIGVRDAQTLAKVAEWRTGGMDPHQLLLDRDGSVVVANGGIPTQPETGRRKLKLSHMDASIARLNPAAQGRIVGQWRLPDARLSLRHLAWGGPVAWAPARRWLGIALQAEHDSAEQKGQAPVLALFDGERLHALPSPTEAQWQGYGGDIGSWAGQFAVSCPKGDALTWWRVPTQACGVGQFVRQDRQQGVYALSKDTDPAVNEAGICAGGAQQLMQWPSGQPLATVPMVLDNHWMQVPAQLRGLQG